MWNSEWKAVSIRIAGIVDASAFLFRNSLTDKRGHGKSAQVLTVNCDETAQSVLDLQRYTEALPKNALAALSRFDKAWKTVLQGRGPHSSLGFDGFEFGLRDALLLP